MSRSTALEGQSFHLIGVGGAGMSVVAELLKGQGAEVTGSDRQDSAVLQSLITKGIGAYFPHDADRVPEAATVIISSAIRESNPELIVARERGQNVVHRSRGLALAAEGQPFVAVAGAHGKTSTSAMIAVALLNSGVDASYAIGGPVLGEGSGARVGSEVFVAEADESDGSFLHYAPAVEVITNVEPDHLDHYASRDEFIGIFRQFVDRLIPGGTLICCAEDAGSAEISQYGRTSDGREHRVITYGRPERSIVAPEVEITDVVMTEKSAAAVFNFEGQSYPLRLGVTGEHSILNAAGAWAACVACGVDGMVAVEALGHFRGAGRRFELRGEVGGRRVYDDYAHHPTEVEVALRQARIVAGEGRVIAVFQPHLYSRTLSFADRFAEVLSGADEVVLADIYAAREDPISGVTTALVANSPKMKSGAHLVPDMDEAARKAALLTKPGDVCILIGAGDIFLRAPLVESVWLEEDGK
ncbi:UDP-N-acetylmuramate--L-alanine ligase [Actinomyces minihominis]|uniref:UDP-N-acetylmuramate--L-alanine ligase n=1 Tax=Actinomyces minihominis TaxID=2002838 RepID=UPI000C0787FA|nr:UDP-N-acetylmuramate--L-alanine ligase [Actinomyces minihominis]